MPTRTMLVIDDDATDRASLTDVLAEAGIRRDHDLVMPRAAMKPQRVESTAMRLELPITGPRAWPSA